MPSVIPLVPIHLDGIRNLRFDRRAFFQSEVELSRLWGEPRSFFGTLQALAAAVEAGDLLRLSLNDVAVLLWQGLVHESPGLTLAQVQDLLPYNDMAALMPLIGSIFEAWRVASPEPEPGTSEAPDSNPLDGSTGTPSGALSVLASA